MVDKIRRSPELSKLETITTKNSVVPNPYYTEDENMLKALALVNQTARKYKVEHDLHSQSIMVRNTGRGWQPVITDPLP